MDKNSISVKELIETLFKYRGTNYSQVASKLLISRQSLFRMVKSGTIKMSMLMEILDLLEFDFSFKDMKNDQEEIFTIPVNGERIRKKIKGTVYDTDKMFSVLESEWNEHVKEILCYEPISRTFLLAKYYDGSSEECHQYPLLSIIDEKQKNEFLRKNCKK